MQLLKVLSLAAAAAVVAVEASVIPRDAPAPQVIQITRPASKKQHPSKAFLSTQARLFPHGFTAAKNALAAAGVPLTDFSDNLYTAPVSVGSGQSFTIDLDTGSSDVWFHGSNCQTSDGSCGTSATQVNVGDSAISDSGNTYSESYGSGSVSGEVYTGPVTLGSYSVSNLAFGASTQETGFNSPGSGLFGLAYNQLNSISGNSNFVSAANIGVFGMYLANSKNGDTGEITLGGTDSSKYTGSITYLKNNGGGTFYQFANSGSFAVGKTKKTLSGNAIADSGTTQIILTTTDANTINTAIGANSDGSISCSNAGPAVSFTFGGRTFSITNQYYVLNDGSGNCFSGFGGGAESLGGMVIYGDVFIRAYYTIFDITNNRVGFAQAVHP